MPEQIGAGQACRCSSRISSAIFGDVLRTALRYFGSMPQRRRFPLLWSIDETPACFIVGSRWANPGLFLLRGGGRPAIGSAPAHEGRGAPTRCKLRQAAGSIAGRRPRVTTHRAHCFREAPRTGQSNGRKTAGPVRALSCHRPSPRERLRRVPRKGLSLVHQQQPGTGAAKATSASMARTATTPASPTAASTVTAPAAAAILSRGNMRWSSI
jgi:hypothetical protein